LTPAFLTTNHQGDYPFYPLYVGRRIWRVFDLLAPSLKLDPRLGFIPERKTYPATVRPDRQDLSAQHVMALLRDHYQGTEFDTSKGLKAGPFGSPVQYDPNQYFSAGVAGGWERPISIYRQLFSFVAVSRDWLPDEVGGFFWFGHGPAHTTAYVPFYASALRPPASYLDVRQTTFSQDASWWAFDFVSNWATLKYRYMVKDIQEAQREAEAQGEVLQLVSEQHALELLLAVGSQDADKSVAEFLTEVVCGHASAVTAGWWQLAWKLVAKYADGYVANEDGSRQQPGYPTPWLKQVGFEEFPGDSFINPRWERQQAPSVGGLRATSGRDWKQSRREIL
jgi:dipeptidase